jgi:cell division transport system permease protein
MGIGYFLRETLVNLKRNLLMTIAAISTIGISLLLLGGVQILGIMVSNVTVNLEDKVDISAYFSDSATEQQISGLQRELQSTAQVKDVEFISKSEAFDEFRKRFRDQPELWRNIPPDSLPASLRITLTDAKYSDLVAALARAAPGVDDVRFSVAFVKRLLQVNALLRTITLVMSIALLIASVGLIANAIRLAIYARREEIGIMKLVGATNWFIRVPFLLEGLFAALVGALLSGGAILAANEWLFPRVAEFAQFLGPVFHFTSSEISQVLLLMLATGLAVGLLGSGMALRRFLET